MTEEEIELEKKWRRAAAIRYFSTGNINYIPRHCLKHIGQWCNDANWTPTPLRSGGPGLYTWKAVSSLWVTIIKVSPEHTGLLIHPIGFAEENCEMPKTLHRMTQNDGLSKDCPPGTCLLGQIIFDRPRGSQDPMATSIPNILVFDVMQIGTSLDATNLSARERYGILRGDCYQFLYGSSINIQWAGDLEPARDFCSSRRNALPHDVECIFRLSNEHPCDVVGSWTVR